MPRPLVRAPAYALGLRHYVAMLIAAVLQAGRAAAESPGGADYSGRTHVRKDRNATLSHFAI